LNNFLKVVKTIEVVLMYFVHFEKVYRIN